MMMTHDTNDANDAPDNKKTALMQAVETGAQDLIKKVSYPLHLRESERCQCPKSA